jgi:selenocysteine-specific elongation factor
LPGDRFIIRRFSPVATIGGGAVLDPLAPLHRRKDASVLPLLSTIERGDKYAILAMLAGAELRGLSLARLIARTGWLEAEARESISRLTATGTLAILEEEPLTVMPASAVDALVPRIRQELEKFHRANPLVVGIPKEDLRGLAGAKPEIFRAALAKLTAARAVAFAGDLVQSAGREIALLPEEARAKELIAAEFERAGLAVPRFEEVLGKLPVEKQRAQKILQILLREKMLVKITADLVFHQNAVARLRELIANYKKTKGSQLPIGAFKDLTGVTRKYAIPLLEYLDRERVTRRVGDERVIL